MSESKQTTVEFFESELLYDSERNVYYIHVGDLEKVKTQAKAMEKEQKEHCFTESRKTHSMIGFKHKSFEEYYNETYKTDKGIQTKD